MGWLCGGVRRDSPFPEPDETCLAVVAGHDGTPGPLGSPVVGLGTSPSLSLDVMVRRGGRDCRGGVEAKEADGKVLMNMGQPVALNAFGPKAEGESWNDATQCPPGTRCAARDASVNKHMPAAGSANAPAPGVGQRILSPDFFSSSSATTTAARHTAISHFPRPHSSPL